MRFFDISFPSKTTSLSIAIGLLFNLAASAGNLFDQPVLHPEIPLLDEAGQHVLNSGQPYSSRMSCGNGDGGGCHDIDKISSAYHFDMGRKEADDHFGVKRNVVPLVSPGYFGGYNCMLQNNPLWLSKKANNTAGEFLDYGAPGLVANCGGCHNGGGFAEKDRNGNRYDQTDPNTVADFDGDYFEWQNDSQPSPWDWQKSGVFEPDCLICHADFSQLKNTIPADTESAVVCTGMDCSLSGTDAWNDMRSNQLLKTGRFRYANSAIFKFLNINPGGTELFLLNEITNLGAKGDPVLQWNPAAFDDKGRMKMPMTRFPGNDNCMVCHNTSFQRRGFYGFGPASTVEYDANDKAVVDYQDDVHKGKTWTENGQSRDLENCNGCHSKQYYKATYSNADLDADHNFPVGNSDQDIRRDLNFQPGPLSCEHCHGGAAFGSSETPALPSGQTTLLAAHRELWKDNGDMVGYPSNTLDRVVQVHFDDVACQTCHSPNVKYKGADINIRYRYHETEDGRLKSFPYQATPRYYWWDKTNRRVLSRRERLQMQGNTEGEPVSYLQVKQLKAGFDALLTEKGYQNVATQLVWTESNDYLISHNTKPKAQTMPCDDCHSRDSKGKVSSLLRSDGIYGINNKRVVASMQDSTAYPRLVSEDIVKLDMPYFQLDKGGRIVENVSEVLYQTQIDPSTSALRANSQANSDGEFKSVETSLALAQLGLDNDAAASSAVESLSNSNLFLMHNRIASNEMQNFALMLGVNSFSQLLAPSFRVEASTSRWNSLAYRLNKKKTKPVSNFNIKYRNQKGKVSSSVFHFKLKDPQQQMVHGMANQTLLMKLPYAGNATEASGVGFLAVDMDADGNLKKRPFGKVSSQIISVRPGSTYNYGYVLVKLNELPEHGLLFDLNSKKKK